MINISVNHENINQDKYWVKLEKFTYPFYGLSYNDHIIERINSFKAYHSTYRLLAYLSTCFNNSTIIELGSRYGLSALALSYNNSNKVISYDIDDQRQTLIKKSNLEFRIENIINQDKIFNLLPASLIFIDTDPHDGKHEQFIIDYFNKQKYTGIVIIDDIYFGGVSTVWNTLTLPKYDISQWKEDTASGMGLINFNIELTFNS